MAFSYRRAGGYLYNYNNFKLFKRQGSRLQEICTLTGTSVKIEFTERQPVVAYLKDGPRQERFGAAKVVNRRAQQHVRHFALKAWSHSGRKLPFTDCDVIKSRIMGPHRLPACGCGRWTGNRKLFGVAL